MSDTLHRLAAAHGIAVEFQDIWGNTHRVTRATLEAVLAAMHVDASDDARCAEALLDVEREDLRRPTAPMTVVRAESRPWRIRARVPAADATMSWEIVCEDGAVHAGVFAGTRAVDLGAADPDALRHVDADLDVALPCGYHELTLSVAGSIVAATTLAVVPSTCYRPAALRDGGRRWGVSVQLYGLRSTRNWGIGDFTDLARLVTIWGDEGADVIGLNPLHALRLCPMQPSPYSPSSRLFVSALYVDVEAVPEYAECDEARALVASPDFAATLDRLRSSVHVDYAGVAASKLDVLARLHAFARRATGDAAAARAARFDAFRRDGGDALRRHALFETLQEHFYRADPSMWGWPAWPDAFRDPASEAVRQFEADHAERVDFHAWLQWQIAQQRAAVASVARDRGLALGLYADLAVSIDRGGSEAWSDQALYATGARGGAPPDAFNMTGQDWGLPPMVPRRLVDAGYAPFIATLRACMRDAGALRIDHVMGLLRLYWVPAGMKASEGAYVRYPFFDILGLLALESQRQRCVVIGEDLGTVPDQVRHALGDADVLSYRVLLFERDGQGAFKPPAEYPQAAVAVASTHDLPTLAGWWEGRDVVVRAQHGLLGAATTDEAELAARGRDRALLLDALQRERLIDDGAPRDPRSTALLSADVAIAVQRFLARTPATLAIVQAEDVLGVRDQVNLPGTIDQYPNWRQKLPLALDDAKAVREAVRALADGLRSERGRAHA